MRKLLRGICGVFFASGVLWANPAAAVNIDGYDIPYAAVLYDYEISDGVRDSSNGNAFQFTGGWPLSEHGAAELSFFNVSRSRDIDGKDDYQIGLFVNYVHDFGLYGFDAPYLPNFKPYLLGGPGWVHDDVRGSTHDNFGLDAGGGLLFPLKIGHWDWGWAVRTEATAIVQIQSDETIPDHRVLADYHLTLGVQIPLTPFFASRHAPVEPPPEQPPHVVPVEQAPPAAAAPPCQAPAPGQAINLAGCKAGDTLVLRGVNFKTGSALLTDQATQVLDQVADALNGRKDVKVEIAGHTDNVGKPSYNLALSQKRAEAVRQYLIGKGVDAARLSARGYGATQPIADNGTEQGRAENRRVELKITVQ